VPISPSRQSKPNSTYHFERRKAIQKRKKSINSFCYIFPFIYIIFIHSSIIVDDGGGGWWKGRKKMKKIRA